MLEGMLFVGVGGSGAKTLVALKNILEDRLEEKGLPRAIPDAWQFVVIDLPPMPNQVTGRIEGDLPGYQGLAPVKKMYTAYDSQLKNDDSLLDDFATWRPNPGIVDQPPWEGAGQFRAIGRTIVVAELKKAVDAINSAVGALMSQPTQQAFGPVQQAFEGRAATFKTPGVILVGSMAGGSGAGTFLDICDALRGMVATAGWLNDVAAILYTAQVFETLASSDRAGIEANALASMQELLAARYDRNPFLPYHRRAGVVAAPAGHRGPNYPFLVGRDNGSGFALADDVEVYLATAQLLAELTTNAGFQSDFLNTTKGNWAQSQTTPDSNPLRPSHYAKPVSALGFARLSLGRDRFEKYASERLTHATVDHLLNGHRHYLLARGRKKEEIAGLPTAEVVDEIVGTDDGELVRVFLDRCGLNEVTEDHNDVLDQLLDPRDVEADLKALSSRVLSAAAGKGNRDGADWFSRVGTQLEEPESQFVSKTKATMEEKAVRLEPELCLRIAAVVSQMLAEYGLEVTISVLEAADKSLNRVVSEELPAERTTRKNRAAESEPDARRAAVGILQKAIRFENPSLRKVMSDLTTNRPRLLVGVELRTIAISLISSLRGSMIGPLLSGLTDARDDLATYSTTADYQDLARGPIVPSRLAPSPNEVLVDPISGYGDTFADLVSATLGRSATTSPALDPIAAAAVLVLLDDQQLPDSSRAQLGIVGVPSARTGSMGVTVRLESNDLMNRSKAWMRKDPTAGIGAFLSQSLATYLAEGSQALVRKKRNDFEVAFDQAILLAQPLVRQDITRLELTHQIGTTSANLPVVRLAVSPIPLPDGSPGRAEAETVLLKHGVMKSSLDAKFSATTEEQSIVIATQSAVVHPCVIPSYTDPIVSKWQSTTDRPQVFGQMRQARSLLESVPLPHESLEMIIRGWFVANWLGMVVERRVGRGTRLFVIDHEGTEVLLPAESPSGSSKGNDDDLPMIIEAYAIEEVLASAGASTLDGYFRLFELGSGDELIDFVATGAHQSKETPTDATEQNPVLQRFKPIEARLTERIQQAEQDASVKPKTIWRAIPRREALAPLLLRAYTTLLTDVAAAAPSEEQPLASQGPPRA